MMEQQRRGVLVLERLVAQLIAIDPDKVRAELPDFDGTITGRCARELGTLVKELAVLNPTEARQAIDLVTDEEISDALSATSAECAADGTGPDVFNDSVAARLGAFREAQQ